MVDHHELKKRSAKKSRIDMRVLLFRSQSNTCRDVDVIAGNCMERERSNPNLEKVNENDQKEEKMMKEKEVIFCFLY